MFAVNEVGEPVHIAESFPPAWNSFVFFEVNAASFHQVSEVLSPNKERLSISGWFHGPPLQRPPPYEEPEPLYTPPKPYLASRSPSDKSTTTTPASILAEWINPIYLDKDSIASASATFEVESSIELPNFLKEDKYMELVDCMDEQDWQYYGPANRRHYQRLMSGAETDLVRDFRRFFQSQDFCDYLNQLTKLELVTFTDQGTVTTTTSLHINRADFIKQCVASGQARIHWCKIKSWIRLLWMQYCACLRTIFLLSMADRLYTWTKKASCLRFPLGRTHSA